MSKRFGRNQKRKLRADVERFRGAADRLADKVTAETRRYGELEGRVEDWSRAILSQLGPGHPFNERIMELVEKRLPELYERRRFSPPGREMTSYQTLERHTAHPRVAQAIIEAVAHLVEVGADRVTPTVRCIIRAPDKSAAYMIDERALQDGRRDPRFVTWISREVARKLAQHLTGRP